MQMGQGVVADAIGLAPAARYRAPGADLCQGLAHPNDNSAAKAKSVRAAVGRCTHAPVVDPATAIFAGYVCIHLLPF